MSTHDEQHKGFYNYGSDQVNEKVCLVKCECPWPTENPHRRYCQDCYWQKELLDAARIEGYVSPIHVFSADFDSVCLVEGTVKPCRAQLNSACDKFLSKSLGQAHEQHRLVCTCRSTFKHMHKEDLRLQREYDEDRRTSG